MKSKGEKANSDKYTITDARRLWMVWWNRNQPDLLNLKAKHHAEGQRAFQQLLTEARTDLRTDEAIERVAKAEFNREQADYEYFDREDWEDQHPSNQDVFRSRARTAITALLEEEDDE